MASRQTTARSRRQDTESSTRRRAGRPSPARRPDATNVQVDQEVFEELLLQALETERGGIQVYEAAVACAQNPDLKQEWEEYLEQTRNHERLLLEYFGSKGYDPEEQTVGRQIVATLGKTFVEAMQKAQREEPEGAECVACECVVLAETKDHMNWELLRACAEARNDGELMDACDEVEEQEDEHLYHTMGWTREVWLDGLGFEAEMPPREEEEEVRTMTEAGQAVSQRKQGIKKEIGSRRGGRTRSHSARASRASRKEYRASGAASGKRR
jgi:rubrerythrin